MITAAGIRQVLPHRYPMLLVDRVVELVDGERLTALKAVTCNEPWYRDLPDQAGAAGYDYPAVLVAESWCQAAGVLAAWRRRGPGAAAADVMLFGGVREMRFTGRVSPGDVLEHRVRQLRAFENSVIFEGESLVGGRPVLTVCRMTIAWRPATEVAAGPAEAAAGPAGAAAGAGPGPARPAARAGPARAGPARAGPAAASAGPAGGRDAGSDQRLVPGHA